MMRGWSLVGATAVGLLLTGACGDDGGGEGGGSAARAGTSTAGTAGAHAGKGGSGGKPAAGGSAGTTAGTATAGQTDGSGGSKNPPGAGGSTGARAGGDGSGGMHASGGTTGTAGSTAGTSPTAGTDNEGGTQGGEAGLGNAGAAGVLETAGAGATSSTGGGGGRAGSGMAGSGMAGAGGGTTPFCTQASDCDTKIGPRGCGAWTCSLAGECEVAVRCEDGDADGFGVGPDCACAGKAIDCDDGDPGVGDNASSSCCNGGTRSCTNGSWGLCSTTTGEMCNGVDDDCNGAVDDLPSVTCGLGACRQTVAACSGNQPTACVPLAPATTVDDCNGIDDDCDGAIDEDCSTCFHVAPDGDDAAAAASHGATPFRNVQTALDFADAHRELAHRVCVAAGAACGAAAAYQGPAGDLTMRDGISLLANYESTSWSHCENSTTHLAPQTGRGVVFPANIAIQTALDGFTIDRPYADVLVTGVTVDGARGVVLSNLTIVGGQTNNGLYTHGEAYGVDLRNGADASVVRSRIEGGYGWPANAAIHAADSRVSVEDNCAAPTDATTGRCATACSASGAQIMALQAADSRYAIRLENSPESRIERSTICARAAKDSVDHDSYGSGGIRASGNARNLVIRANSVGGDVWTDPTDPVAAIAVDECGGASPWIGDNQSLGANIKENYAEAVRAVGDCHPVIEANQQIQNNAAAPYSAGRAVVCAAGTVPSRCSIVNNPALLGLYEKGDLSYVAGGESNGTGVTCTGGSCALIRGNTVTGITTNLHCTVGACQRGGTPLYLEGSGANRIEKNLFVVGLGTNMSGFSVFHFRTSTVTQAGVVTHNLFNSGLVGQALDFESNRVGAPYPCSTSLCFGTQWSGGGTVSNNCFSGAGATYAAFAEKGAAADPLVFVGNNLSSGGGPAYLDEGTTALTTAAQVNALTDMTVSGTTTGACPLPFPP